jgi:hypothetical protein
LLANIEDTMPQPKIDLALCTAPTDGTGETEMYRSEPDKMDKKD